MLFLNAGTFPALKTLRLVGFLDRTDVSSFKDLASPPSHLAFYHLHVFGLLGVLKMIGVTQLILENSVGHPNALLSCVFEREAEGEWTSRQVRRW